MTRKATLALPTLSLIAGVLLLPALVRPEKEPEPSDFIRFRDLGGGEGKLETAVVRYGKDDVEVSLVAAVHIGDPEYYDGLEELFATYDALLYEMVKEKGVEPGKGERPDSLISMFQKGLKNVLELEFQLDAIDYSRKNFVHADMDADEFFRAMSERGESFMTLLVRGMLEQWKRQMEGEGPQITVFHLIAAFASEDSARALKYLLGREFEEIEAMVLGMESSGDGEGTVLLTGRNKAAIRALEKELDKGRKKLGIFYGGAHMQDLEKRLRDRGFEKLDQRWVVAWDIRKKGSRRGAEEEEAEGARNESVGEEKPGKKGEPGKEGQGEKEGAGGEDRKDGDV